MEKLPLGQLLLELGYVTEEQIAVAVGIQSIRRKLLGEILVEQSFVSPKEVAIAISRQSGRPYVDVSDYPSSPEALRVLNRNLAKQMEVLPLSLIDNKFTVAVADPFDINTIDVMRRRSGVELNLMVSDRETILKRTEILYYLLDKPINEEIKGQLENMRASGRPTDIPSFLSNILNHALIDRATDIHIAPEEHDTHVFFRIDGILRHYYACPKFMHAPIVSRIKILSNLDISEQRFPQDGAFNHEFFDETFDLRVSTLPSLFGENVVMRVLSKNLSLFSLEGLGFEDKTLNRLIQQFDRTQGIVLVTGPTGSGKTTTLYAGLRKINSLQRRVLTAEDPVEYKFPFIKQTQINEKSGYNFLAAMKAFLRQDPDVILLGEMRDEHTAEIALRAAITGHLVLSTLHTSDAVSSIPRLLDLGVKDYFIASAVKAIIAQRLMRKVCPFCKEDREVPARSLLDMGFEENVLKNVGIELESTLTFPYGNGCDYCRGTGYFGRVVISELLIIDTQLSEMIVQGSTPLALLEVARQHGMNTMEEDGLFKSLKMLSNPEEVKRVTA